MQDHAPPAFQPLLGSIFLFIAPIPVHFVHTDAILSFDGLNADGTENANCFVNGTLNPKLPLCTGGIFATYPAPHLSLANGFLDQVYLPQRSSL